MWETDIKYSSVSLAFIKHALSFPYPLVITLQLLPVSFYCFHLALKLLVSTGNWRKFKIPCDKGGQCYFINQFLFWKGIHSLKSSKGGAMVSTKQNRIRNSLYPHWNHHLLKVTFMMDWKDSVWEHGEWFQGPAHKRVIVLTEMVLIVKKHFFK